jgi:hypothetical protein
MLKRDKRLSFSTRVEEEEDSSTSLPFRKLSNNGNEKINIRGPLAG